MMQPRCPPISDMNLLPPFVKTKQTHKQKRTNTYSIKFLLIPTRAFHDRKRKGKALNIKFPILPEESPERNYEVGYSKAPSSPEPPPSGVPRGWVWRRENTKLKSFPIVQPEALLYHNKTEGKKKTTQPLKSLNCHRPYPDDYSFHALP
ncbi:uncharacterized protein TM35_000361110 [Trypanosoma theileri]|uniref:Uncharacterized protein n=1 Tax=Trypanosoma theileri TaxID=67003 RepID=A0A1X0NL01_9TRYP|nr:uncharacterized protein TM35_000361110 [Trypanosoma theileri]ORC85251.1 hypothetical protein TM35_000361110 [Trypanosoma theileri]